MFAHTVENPFNWIYPSFIHAKTKIEIWLVLLIMASLTNAQYRWSQIEKDDINASVYDMFVLEESVHIDKKKKLKIWKEILNSNYVFKI